MVSFFFDHSVVYIVVIPNVIKKQECWYPNIEEHIFIYDFKDKNELFIVWLLLFFIKGEVVADIRNRDFSVEEVNDQ